MSNNKRQIGVSVDTNTYNQLLKIANGNCRTIAGQVRFVLQNYLEAKAKREAMED